jgi:hypothetical protein
VSLMCPPRESARWNTSSSPPYLFVSATISPGPRLRRSRLFPASHCDVHHPLKPYRLLTSHLDQPVLEGGLLSRAPATSTSGRTRSISTLPAADPPKCHTPPTCASSKRSPKAKGQLRLRALPFSMSLHVRRSAPVRSYCDFGESHSRQLFMPF